MKHTQHVAETLLYRSFTIYSAAPGGPRGWPQTQKIIDRILDPDDVLASVVRELTVEYLSVVGAVETLMRLLGRIENLQDFR